MKGTDEFKKTIEKHLNDKAMSDFSFMARLDLKTKNIDDCVQYILNEVQKSKCNGFTDDEIFGMAAHYYDEDKIDIGKKSSATVVVNHKVKAEPKKEQPKKVEKKPKMEVAKPESTQTSMF